MAASAPIVKVMIVAMVGAASATERAGILTQEGLKSLSRIIIYILVPAFLFTKLAGTLTVEKLGMWWLIVAFTRPKIKPDTIIKGHAAAMAGMIVATLNKAFKIDSACPPR